MRADIGHRYLYPVRPDGMSCSESLLNSRNINNGPGKQRYTKNYTIE